MTGEIRADGRVEFDGHNGAPQMPADVELDCGCILSVTRDGNMHIQYCRPDCETIKMVADEIRAQKGYVQKVFPAEN